MLVDPSLTSVRLVLNPEKMVIKEAQRTYTYFNLFGYPCDLVVCNRVLPDGVARRLLRRLEGDPGAATAPMVEERFAPIPIRELPLFHDEVVGLDRLRRDGPRPLRRATTRRGSTSVAARQQIERSDGGYILAIPLPFARKPTSTCCTSATSCSSRSASYRSERHPAAHPGRPLAARRQLRRRHPQNPLRPRPIAMKLTPSSGRIEANQVATSSRAPLCVIPEAANPPVIQSAIPLSS